MMVDVTWNIEFVNLFHFTIFFNHHSQGILKIAASYLLFIWRKSRLSHDKSEFQIFENAEFRGSGQ